MWYRQLGFGIGDGQLADLDRGMRYRACLPSCDGDVPDLGGLPAYGHLWHPATGVLVECVESEDGTGSWALAFEGATPDRAALAGPSWTESSEWRGPGRRVTQEGLGRLLAGQRSAWEELFYDPDDDPAHNVKGMNSALRIGTVGGWLIAYCDLDGEPGPGAPLADALEAADALAHVEVCARVEGMDPTRWACQRPSSAQPVALGAGLRLSHRDELMEALDLAARSPQDARPPVCAAFTASEGTDDPWDALVWRGGAEAGRVRDGEWAVPDLRAAEDAASAALRGDVMELAAWELLGGEADDLARDAACYRMSGGAPVLHFAEWRGSGGPFERAQECDGAIYCPDLWLLVGFLHWGSEDLMGASLRFVAPAEVLREEDTPGSRFNADDFAYDNPDLVLPDLAGSYPSTCASLAALVDDPSREWAFGSKEIVQACRAKVARESESRRAEDEAQDMVREFFMRLYCPDLARQGPEAIDGPEHAGGRVSAMDLEFAELDDESVFPAVLKVTSPADEGETYILTPGYRLADGTWERGVTSPVYSECLDLAANTMGGLMLNCELRETAQASYRVARDKGGPMLICAEEVEAGKRGEYFVEFLRPASGVARSHEAHEGWTLASASRVARGCASAAQAAQLCDRWGGFAVPYEMGAEFMDALRGGDLGASRVDWLSQSVAEWCGLWQEAGASLAAEERAGARRAGTAAEFARTAGARAETLLELTEEVLRQAERRGGLAARERVSPVKTAAALAREAGSELAHSKSPALRGLVAQDAGRQGAPSLRERCAEAARAASRAAGAAAERLDRKERWL